MLSASLPPRPFVVCIFSCAIARLAFVFSSFQCKTHAIHKTVIHPPFMTWIVKILHSIQLLLHPMFRRVCVFCVCLFSPLFHYHNQHNGDISLLEEQSVPLFFTMRAHACVFSHICSRFYSLLSMSSFIHHLIRYSMEIIMNHAIKSRCSTVFVFVSYIYRIVLHSVTAKVNAFRMLNVCSGFFYVFRLFEN